MTLNVHKLNGCAPAPLANYLKAVGILRLVGEQADKRARGWWDGEVFRLMTSLTKEELETFFLERYEPTPLVAPWNGGSGFFPKDNRKAITAIIDSTMPRFQKFREAISAAELAIDGLKSKPDKKQKPIVFQNCTLGWRGAHREWLDAAVVFDESGKPSFPSLLGTGGNDGRLDFTNNFMQQLVILLDPASENGTSKGAAKELLSNSLWKEPANRLAAAAVGQYQPGAAGGANSSTGFASGNLVNAWDFVLMLEGSILFTSRATKKLDPNAFSRASAPFAVRPHAAGFATPGSEKSQRGEQWMPLWNQPAKLSEVAALYGEGRVQLDRRPANRPVDMARAISRLGVARGIESFVRYGYLERNGQSTLAVPLGRVQVKHRQRAYLIDDLAGWMDRLERRSRDNNAPTRLGHAERRLADAVFAALTHDYSPERWQAILRASSEIEAIQVTGTAIDAGPIPILRPEWGAAADDGTAEVRLALALGSAAARYSREGRPLDPVRYHWLPLEPGARRFKTTEKRIVNDPRVVMTGRDPIRDLIALIDRRLIEATMKGERRSRLAAAPGCGARLGDLTQFLNGSLDLNKLLGLARAFMAIEWNQWSPEHSLPTSPATEPPEDSWLAIRLTCLPWPLARDQDIPADLRVVRLLSAADGTRAIDLASTRLRSSGLRPPIQAGFTDPATARRWAAALAFPIDHRTAFKAAAILDPRFASKKGTNHA